MHKIFLAMLLLKNIELRPFQLAPFYPTMHTAVLILKRCRKGQQKGHESDHLQAVAAAAPVSISLPTQQYRHSRNL